MKNLVAFWKQYKKQILFVLRFVLLFVLLYNVYSKFSGPEFEQTLAVFKSEFSWNRLPYLFLAIILTFFNWGFETLKYYITIQKVEPISYWKAYRGILYGNALNLVLPASIGELTGRPMVLKEENRVQGSGVAYYVSIVQKVASPFVGLIFLYLAVHFGYLAIESIKIWGQSIDLSYFIMVISILDLSFWSWMFIYPHQVMHLIENIQFLRSIFERMEKVISYPITTKLILLAIAGFRFLIFVTQYWLLMFLFFQDFPHFEFYILIGVYFLAQFVVPSFGFLDVGIRANLVAFIFSNYLENFAQLMAVNYLIWIINLFIPSMFGFFLMRKKLI